MPRPCQCVRGRFVAGDEDGHGFVADLDIAQAAARIAVGILGGEKSWKEVAPVAAFGAALGDEPVDRGVEPLLRLLQPAIGARGADVAADSKGAAACG